MKYLDKKFTVAVTEPRRADRELNGLLYSLSGDERRQRERAAKPHEYLNGGSMCLICGLDGKAKIHVVK